MTRKSKVAGEDHYTLRLFTAASDTTVWRAMQELPPHQRHFYEVIRANTPCHLYFDLEYEHEHNPALDGNAMVATLLQITADAVRRLWAVHLSAADVVELESKAPGKWSRHIIVRMPGHALASNRAADVLVNEYILRDPRAAALSIHMQKAGHVQQGMLVDTAVYTRNRMFRCLFSSKPRKNNPFAMTGRYPPGVCRLDRHSQWQLSLVCNVPASDTLVTCPGRVPEHMDSCGQQGDGRAAGQGWPSARPGASGELSSFTSFDGDHDHVVKIKWGVFGAQPNKQQYWFFRKALSFMQEAARQLIGYQDITVVKVTPLGLNGLVTFDLDNQRASHTCLWENRLHKHNFAYFVANFWQGAFTQQCWDPDCRRKHGQRWKFFDYALPDYLIAGKDLFEEPVSAFDPPLEEMLVAVDGSRNTLEPNTRSQIV